MPYIWGTIHHMMVHMCKRIISPVFFHISQIFIFWVISRVKELKLSRMTKTLCLLHSISQEAYILWSWVFGIHVLNDDISRFFFFLQKFDFPVCSVQLTLSLGPYIICLWFLVLMFEMVISPAIFFIFSKF